MTNSNTISTTGPTSSATTVSTVRRSYKFRLDPTRRQATRLRQTLDLCRELYNGSVQERREAYYMTHARMSQTSITFKKQSRELVECKLDECRPDLESVYSQVLQDVQHRVDKSFAGFFRRLAEHAAGQKSVKPGYPRYQPWTRYSSFTYPQLGWHLQGNLLTLSKIGTLKLKMHRPIPADATIKTVTIKREGLGKQARWYAIFSCELALSPAKHKGPQIGIDMGLEHYANLSTGEQIDNPRWLRHADKRLKAAQKELSATPRQPKNNPARNKKRTVVTHLHRKVREQRRDFQHKTARALANTYSFIAVEDLQIANMVKRPKPKLDEAATIEQGQPVYAPNGAAAKAGLNKSIQDAGWASFLNMLASKVEWTGGRLVRVDPRYTSCTCPDCGVVRPKELWERGHTCECGAVYHRDTAAALVVLARGLANEVQAPAQELGQDKQVTRGLSCVRAAQADPLEAAGL